MVGINNRAARNRDVDSIQVGHGAQDKKPEHQKPAHAGCLRLGHRFAFAGNLSGVLAQDARQLFSDDLIFAGLQHERAHRKAGPAFAPANHDCRFGIP
jgi:hypothetical protein